MAEHRVERRLAAVLAADVAGYSRLMGQDDIGTLRAMKARRTEIIAPIVAAHHGRFINTPGDSMLLEFVSAVDAVNAAIAIQTAMEAGNNSIPDVAPRPQQSRRNIRLGLAGT